MSIDEDFEFNDHARNEIIDALFDVGMIGADFNRLSVETEDDLLMVIRESLGDKTYGILGEDIGTDNDAGEDYEQFIQGFSALSEGDFKFENLSSTTEGDDVTIQFRDRGNDHEWKFEQYSDHLSEDFLDLIIDFSRKNGDGQFIDLKARDFFQFGYVPNKVADLLYKYGIIYAD